MSDKLYSSPQITRAYQLVEALAGHEMDPLTNKDICRATGWEAPVATRMCQAAMAANFVEKTLDGRFRLKRSTFTNIAISVQNGIQRAQARMNDEANNYTRSSY